MNQALWNAMREYIAAEVKLAIARSNFQPPEETQRLEEQSTRMESDIRRRIHEIELKESNLQRMADFNTVLR